MQGRHLGSEDRENFDGDGLSFEPGEVLANFPAGLTAPFLWIRSCAPPHAASQRQIALMQPHCPHQSKRPPHFAGRPSMTRWMRQWQPRQPLPAPVAIITSTTVVAIPSSTTCLTVASATPVQWQSGPPWASAEAKRQVGTVVAGDGFMRKINRPRPRRCAGRDSVRGRCAG